MYQLPRLIKAFREDEEGATVVEYGVIIALIISACVVIINILGGKVEESFNDFETKFETTLSTSDG